MPGSAIRSASGGAGTLAFGPTALIWLPSISTTQPECSGSPAVHTCAGSSSSGCPAGGSAPNENDATADTISKRKKRFMHASVLHAARRLAFFLAIAHPAQHLRQRGALAVHQDADPINTRRHPDRSPDDQEHQQHRE